MNNLHRELAPISAEAWAEIEDEASRTLKRYLAGRRVVDVEEPAGTKLSSVGTGHQSEQTAWRRIHDGVEVIAELLLRGPQNRLPAAPHAAGRARRRGATCAIHRD